MGIKEKEILESNEESQKPEVMEKMETIKGTSDKNIGEYKKIVNVQHQKYPQQESEEVLHSDGEVIEVLYPDNTWDSDDTLLQEDELSLPIGMDIKILNEILCMKYSES